MSINVFRTMVTANNATSVFTPITQTLQSVNDWQAYRMSFSETTTINGFALLLRSQASGSFDVSVGISTSMRDDGIFPYVISQELMNSNVGTAKTIGFTYEIQKTIDNTVGFGTGYENLTFVSSSTAFTMDPFTNYWIGVKVNTVNSAGSFILADLCTNGVDNFSTNQFHAQSYQRLASAIGVTARTDFISAIPFFSNPSTGTTEYHPKYLTVVDNYQQRYDLNSSGREFGIKFEFNVFPFQDWEVYSISYLGLRSNVVNSEYCMRVYDGPNFTNVVGTALTMSFYDCNSSIIAQTGDFEFLFNPPLKLRTNKTYFAGIAWTHPTTQPNSSAYTEGIFNLRDLQSDQSSIFAFRNTVGSGALTEIVRMKMPLMMYIKRTNSVSRAIGN